MKNDNQTKEIQTNELQTKETATKEAQHFSLKLSEVAQILGGSLTGEDGYFKGLAYDSRQLKPGQLFVAIPGETVDGHQFIEEVYLKAAAGALVNRITPSKLPQILVENSVAALCKLAAYYRNQFSLPIIALTGSCGKTTVKEMVVKILSLSGSLLSTQGNLNTEIGVPLTLFHLSSEHQFGVIEMGARKPGDIKCLMEMVNPDVTLITNAGVAHLGVFGDTQTIAKAKGEIFENLKGDGIAIINADDAHAEYWRSLLPTQTIINFGLNFDPEQKQPKQKILDKRTEKQDKKDNYKKNNENEHKTAGSALEKHSQNIWVGVSHLKLRPEASTFNLHLDDQIFPITLAVPGKHSVSNALSAAASAYAVGIDAETIKQGLESFNSYTGRLQFKMGKQGSRIIDDTYNANPVSMKAALEVLSGFSSPKIFVMGDMLEMGKDAESLHREIGIIAKQLSVDVMLGIGNLTKAAVEAFKSEQGLGMHFSDKESLIQELLKQIRPSSTILAKGSRGMRMEEVVNRIVEVNVKQDA